MVGSADQRPAKAHHLPEPLGRGPVERTVGAHAPGQVDHAGGIDTDRFGGTGPERIVVRLDREGRLGLVLVDARFGHQADLADLGRARLAGHGTQGGNGSDAARIDTFGRVELEGRKAIGARRENRAEPARRDRGEADRSRRCRCRNSGDKLPLPVNFRLQPGGNQPAGEQHPGALQIELGRSHGLRCGIFHHQGGRLLPGGSNRGDSRRVCIDQGCGIDRLAGAVAETQGRLGRGRADRVGNDPCIAIGAQRLLLLRIAHHLVDRCGLRDTLPGTGRVRRLRQPASERTPAFDQGFGPDQLLHGIGRRHPRPAGLRPAGRGGNGQFQA